MENLAPCTHCGEKIVIPSILKVEEKELHFCCHGCKTVYEILQSKGLQQYYQLKKNAQETSSPVVLSNEKYLYLNENEFLDKYSSTTETTRTIRFYLEGIHCVACLWLLEKLPEFLPEVLTSELNMSKSICTVTGFKDIKFSKVAKQFEVLGYRPHPIMKSSESEELAKLEDRKMLIKIAVAFAAAGNIMLLATSIYAGLEESFLKDYFKWLNFYIALPVVLYSATPFYHTAWSSLRNKSISIDIPIVLAIIVVMLSGFYNLLTGNDHLYFDSITVLIFLLLLARFILKKAQQKGLSAADVTSFFSNQIANKLTTSNLQESEPVHAKFLKVYDKIIVHPGENIPADGLVLDGRSNINASLLTGESIPEKVEKGSYVYSGTLNMDSTLMVQVMNTAETSRLGKILKSVESGWRQKADIVLFADRVAQYFVIAVLLLSLGVLGYFGLTHNWETGFTRALTLIIITCPCALGLTTPLALTLTLGRLAKNGIIIRNEQIIEKITKAQEIILDKTGTLTYGAFKVSSWEKKIPCENIDPIIYALEIKSKHPVARAITSYLEEKFYLNDRILNPAMISNFSEIPGVGVEGYLGDRKYEIKASSTQSNQDFTTVGIYQDGIEIVTVMLKDELRNDALSAINNLKELKIKPYIVSGDNPKTVLDIADKLNIADSDAYGAISPEDKTDFVVKHPEAIMVGDGANDAMALSNAFVGIAVHGSVDISLRVADVYISKTGVTNLIKLIAASHDTLKVIKRNLIFSIGYNVLGTLLALTGQITPLLAAVFMPLSSLTVLISTFISTKRLKKLDQIK